MEYDIADNPAEQRFELKAEGKMAYSTYRLADGRITFLHTEVPKELEGRGIGSALAKHVLEEARRRNLKVVASCPFIKAYIGKHLEYQGLLA